MSTHVVGFRPPDEEWQRHKAVWDACKAAGVDVPDATSEFFEWDKPDDRGVEVKITVEPYNDEASSGYEIALADLPPNVTHVRFFNSW